MKWSTKDMWAKTIKYVSLGTDVSALEPPMPNKSMTL